MRVVKVDPAWFPYENKSLQVGEAIEISNALELLKEGKVKVYEPPVIRDRADSPVGGDKPEVLAKPNFTGLRAFGGKAKPKKA